MRDIPITIEGEAMRLGMMVRSDDRGLGIQSWEAWRALKPEATVIIADGGNDHGLHPERYPGSVVVPCDGTSVDKKRVLDEFIDCTHVLGFETAYDWSLIHDFDAFGIKTIVQLNPELWPHDRHRDLPHPTQWWNPTVWRLGDLPYATRLVPVPVALDRFPAFAPRKLSERPRILHVVGRQAMADRNGTSTFLQSLQYLANVDVTLTYQGPNAWNHPHLGPGSTIRFVQHSGPYWTLYEDQDIIVVPRRYGGLCLPVQEALAAGLVVVMTDVLPQSETWPIIGIPAWEAGEINTQTGQIEVYDCDPTHVAIKIKDAMNRFGTQQLRSAEWARTHSWDALLPMYRKEIERV